MDTWDGHILIAISPLQGECTCKFAVDSTTYNANFAHQVLYVCVCERVCVCVCVCLYVCVSVKLFK